ncbi:glycosyltransferase family 25 protein [uncultured Microbulbifer sp.]|uniref:glycosyltransferase family 25 protein n=1 Tax=uncultured Microbulbifer sp. TaxID=348147 RepID=UPI002607C780|nr:glycosyltransferase family 25 protein [uncultured Microbulbifer sp.]
MMLQQYWQELKRQFTLQAAGRPSPCYPPTPWAAIPPRRSAGRQAAPSNARQMQALAKPGGRRKPRVSQHNQRLRRPPPSPSTLERRAQKVTAYIAQTPCWVITLHPRGEGVHGLLDVLRSQRLRTGLVAGIDGRTDFPQLETGEYIANAATRWRHLCELTSSEIGCYLAHLRTINRAYRAGFNRICILEDDVQLEPDFGRVLAELERLPPEVEMIRLMGLKLRKRRVVKILGDGIHKLVRPERGWCGAQGYLINREGMQKVLNYANRILKPIDKVFDHFWQFDLHLYGVEPHLLWETEHASSIVKSNMGRTKVTSWLYWLHPIGKLWRSVGRHYYLIRHTRAFYPAQKPHRRTGRTMRIKP